MTVAPSSPSNGKPFTAADETHAASLPGGVCSMPEPAWLGGDLQHRVHLAAAASGISVAALCEQWVREGVERFEVHHPAEDPDGSGRCSLRTGTCSLGPVPLPVQQ